MIEARKCATGSRSSSESNIIQGETFIKEVQSFADRTFTPQLSVQIVLTLVYQHKHQHYHKNTTF